METIRTSTTYFIPPGKFLLMENALGNPDLIQSSVSSDCRVTIVDTANFPLDELEQWPTFRLTSSDVKLKLGEGLYYVYIVVPTPDNAETTTAFISYNTVQVDRKGYDADGKLLGKEKFCYYQCGTVSARGGNPSVVTTPPGKGRVIEMDLGVTPAPSTLPGDLNDFDKIFQLDKVDPNNPKSWLLTILATVKSMTARLVRITGSLVFGSGESEKTVTDVALSSQADDANSVSDTILPTTAWVTARFQTYGDRFLRKDKDDRSVGRISTDEGFEAGKFVRGFLGGTGAWIGADGYGEMSGLTLREFLEVPELRFNRIDVVSGELWNAIAFGMVEEVDTKKRICKIKLEKNERCGLHVGDFCRGIFADFGDGNNWEGEDECGFMHLYGFWTSYFTPTKILDNEEGLFRFEYELKPDTTQHPTQSMKFAVYGHPTDKSRQASAYSTRTYKRYLNNVDTWVIDPDRHIYAQYGDLNGLQINGVKMQGYGSFQSNAYFRGVQIQLPPEQMESLKGDSAYAAQLTSYVGTVKLDADGNMSGGMFEELNVIADGKNVICRDIEQPQTFRNVTTKNHRLTTTVQAYKGTTPLYYSADYVTKGSFTLALACVGCTASVVNGAIIVNSITDTKDCRINITVNCEGMAVYNLEYNVVFVKDGENGVAYELSPSNVLIKQTTTGSIEPEQVLFRLKKRVGNTTKDAVAKWLVYGKKEGEEKVELKVFYSTALNYNFASNVADGYKYFTVEAVYNDGLGSITSSVVVVKDGENGQQGGQGQQGDSGKDAVSYRIEPNIQTISKTMTGTLEPESVKFMLQANKGGVIKYYPTVWSLKGRNLANGEWTTLKSADGVTSFDVVFTANYKYYELSAKTYGDGDIMLGDTLNISIVADGKNGESIKGDKGAMPRYRGEFVPNNESEPYVYDSEYRDIVLHEGNVCQVYMYGSSITEPPSIAPNADNDGKWQRANKFRFVAMDTALIDSANIGGFMFKRTKYIDNVPVGRLESQYGPVVIREVSEGSGDIVPVTIRVTSGNGTTTLTSRIVKTKGDYAYALKPTTRLVTLDKDNNPSVSSISCSLVRKSVSGDSSITSVPTGYTLKYSVAGGTETAYTPNTSITVPKTNGSTIVFRLRDNQSNIVSEEVVYVFSEASTQGTILYDRYIQFACNDDGSVKFGLPYRFRVSQWQGGKEVPLTNITLSGDYVTIDNERIELDAETGTLKCTNVDLTGTINAVSGNIGDWNISHGSMVVSGEFFTGSFNTEYKNILDITGVHVDYGEGAINADLGVNLVTFSKEGTEWFSALSIVDSQDPNIRRADLMCGLYVKGNYQDIGLLVEGCGASHILSEKGTTVYGLSLNTKTVTANYEASTNDDVIIFKNTSNITFRLNSGSKQGKVLYLKRASSGAVTIKGNIRECNSVSGAFDYSVSLGSESVICVFTDSYWTLFYCG